MLKSTMESETGPNLTPVVVKEMTLIGSRCGRFREGLGVFRSYPDIPVEKLVTKIYPIKEAVRAFEHAGERETLKILLRL